MIEFKKTTKIILSIIFVIVLFFVGLGIYVYSEINGFFRNGTDIEISVEEGSSISKISDELKKESLIGNSLMFKVYLKLSKDNEIFKKGDFILQSGSYKDVISALTSLPNNNKYKLTIIEGENLIQISKKVASNAISTEEEFLNAINKKYGFKFEEFIETDILKLFENEGYAFPDTYFYNKNTTAEDIAKLMLSNFDKRFKDDYYERLEELDISFEELITLSSIIQHEASRPEDMKMVASVFYNRLKKGSNLPKLQSDVTVFYARDIVKKITGDDKKVKAYSTYLSDGIPVGPICNPGLDAIEAALYATDNDYLYFLTDLNAKFYYAKTLEEHIKNNKEAEKINNKIKNNQN
ncbi:MAG: endolytic transglycosylase MltG [Oscillospiraceae bacterium]